MNGLIRAALNNPIAVTVMSLAVVVMGALSAYMIPIDILPVFKSPAVQTLVFYGGMPAASIEKNITARLERGVVQATGGRRLSEEEERAIRGELAELHQEHRDLDAVIIALSESPRPDSIRIQRMKKRKLALKDRIAILDDRLLPDIIA